MRTLIQWLEQTAETMLQQRYQFVGRKTTI